MSECQYFDPYINLGQGGSGRSRDGKPLESENHIQCYNIVMLNLETHDALMLHIWEGMHGGFSSRQWKEVNEFCKPLGDKVAIVTEGDLSSRSLVRHNFEKLNINLIKVIKVPTGNSRWHARFYPTSRRLNIRDESGKVYYNDVPFPEYQDVPADEKGLSNAERLTQRLMPYTNSATGELSDTAIQCLTQLLKKSDGFSSPSGDLLHQFVEDRAAKAGFDDYCDYFEANPNNFIDMNPQGPEILLRKLVGMPEKFWARLAAKNVHADAIKVTPDAVVTLLIDHKNVALQFIQTLNAMTVQHRAKELSGACVL